MSYRIEYQWAAFTIAGAPLGLSEDRFILAIEGGDNNVREARTGKRARSWEACMVGTQNQVLRQAVYFAGACEGGGLQPKGRCCKPESYIRRIRELLAASTAAPAVGGWIPRLQAAAEHAAVEELRGIGLEVRSERWFGEPRAIVDVPSEHLAAYLRTMDRHIDTLPAWCWIKVHGLPAS